jgi:hypothetical protein
MRESIDHLGTSFLRYLEDHVTPALVENAAVCVPSPTAQSVPLLIVTSYALVVNCVVPTDMLCC